MKCKKCDKDMVYLGQTKSGYWGFRCFNPNCVSVGEIVEIGFEDLKP